MTTRLVCTHGSYNCNTVDKDGAGTVAGGVVLCCVVWAAVCDVGGSQRRRALDGFLLQSFFLPFYTVSMSVVDIKIPSVCLSRITRTSPIEIQGVAVYFALYEYV